MNDNFRFYKQKVYIDNHYYIDIYVAWSFNNKTYYVRLKPVFGRDFNKLVAIAQEIPVGEPVCKYI